MENYVKNTNKKAQIKKNNKTVEELTVYLYTEIYANETLHHKNIVIYYGQYFVSANFSLKQLLIFL